MIIASLILSSILPCVDAKPRLVTFAQPGSPAYAEMTHIRRTPAPICEPLALVPLLDEPLMALVTPLLPFTPFLPPEGLYAVPGSPFLWGPMDGPPVEESYAGGGYVGGPGGGGYPGGGGGGSVFVPAAPVDEPPTWVLALAAAVLWVRRPLQRFLRESKRIRGELTISDFTTY